MARIATLLDGRRTMSFEFFPPKTDGARATFEGTVAALAPLSPDFVSVTYGAAGSDRHRTAAVVDWLVHETELAPMAHMTCVGHTRNDVAALVVDYRRMGVENILALGGDPPADGSPPAGEYRYALDLLTDVAATGCFSVGVAAHPEVHPRSPDRSSDRRHLAAKLRVADFAITQFFFEAQHWTRLVDELADLGVEKPVVPGIMPFTSAGQLGRMATMSGAELPTWLTDRIDSAPDDAAVRRIGVEVATDLSLQLLDAGAPGLHVYTMNRADAARRICSDARNALV